jgi:hypothetical protein
MYPSPVGNKFLVQYAVSGTGSFDGTEYGRARLTINGSPIGNTTIYIAARLFGTAPNAITVELVNTGAVTPTTYVTQVGSAIRVFLRRSASVVLATAPEVANAINNFTSYTSAGFALRARAHNPLATTVLAAVAAQPLTGGADPHAIGRSQYLWTVPTNGKAGYVDFEQQAPMWLLGFSAKFSSVPVGTHTVTVYRARVLEDFTVVAAEKIPIFVYGAITSAAPDISYTDVRQVVHPAQAVIVETSAAMPGVFNFDVMRAAEFPYA